PSCHVRLFTVTFANASSASRNTKLVPGPGPATGYTGGGTHVRCHSASVHSRPPTDAHAACACGYVTFVHGCTPGREHACACSPPPLAAVASGRDASYFMISTAESGIATHSWPGRSPDAAPSSIVPLQSLSRPSQTSPLAPGPGCVITQTAGPCGIAALHWNVPVLRQSP